MAGRSGRVGVLPCSNEFAEFNEFKADLMKSNVVTKNNNEEDRTTGKGLFTTTESSSAQQQTPMEKIHLKTPKINNIYDTKRKSKRLLLASPNNISSSPSSSFCHIPPNVKEISRSLIPVFNWEGIGCVTCGADSDHANLLICEICNSEYHTYCLDPPLKSVPEGDFYCDTCKPYIHLVERNNRIQFPVSRCFPLTEMGSIYPSPDSLEYMVSALPPKYTSRFGQLVWAAGGVGFGWWPACIYDPRLTVGNASRLAKRSLGKKHLVYFFECHDAPFTALDDTKMYPWLEGFQEDFHLGRTAKSVSKNRGLQFERALLMASVEFEKPVEFRLDWNHQDETNENNENRQLDAHNNSARNTNNGNTSNNNTNRLVQTSSATKKRRTGQSNNGLNKKKGRHLNNRNEQSSTLSSNRMKRRGTSRTNNNLDLMDVEFEEEASDLAIALKLSGEEHYQRNRTTRRGGSREIVKNPKIYFRIIVRKIPSGTNPFSVDAVNNNFFTKSNGKEDKSMDFFHIGFITMDEDMVMSESSFTFSEMRGIMEKELVGDEDVPSLPKKWRFFTYSLGVMRSEQEQKLLVNEFFCQNIFDDAEVQSDETGDGSYSSPFTIMIQDVSPSISSEDLVCHEILPINLT